MATKAPIDAVLILDAFAQLQPIRLPAAAFEKLHRRTARKLSAFVAEHRRRFPQTPLRREGDRRGS